MKITSSAFENNTGIPAKYTCDGENINPALSLSGVPQNAKSLVLIMDDPDAPMGTFVHWIVFNINPKTQKIEENSVPAGSMLGKTSSGKLGYIGSCPPPASPEQLQRGESGTHRYFFKLYALDNILNLESPDKATLEKQIQSHILDHAELVGLYMR